MSITQCALFDVAPNVDAVADDQQHKRAIAEEVLQFGHVVDLRFLHLSRAIKSSHHITSHHITSHHITSQADHGLSVAGWRRWLGTEHEDDHNKDHTADDGLHNVRSSEPRHGG